MGRHLLDRFDDPIVLQTHLTSNYRVFLLIIKITNWNNSETGSQMSSNFQEMWAHLCRARIQSFIETEHYFRLHRLFIPK